MDDKDKLIAELKAENEKLEFRVQKLLEDLSCSNKCLRNKINIEHKYKQTLQEIKEIAMGIMDDDIEESSAYSDARHIIDLITKAESEG